MKLGVSHLQIFVFLVYCHVPLNKRMKLDPTTEKGILTGYSETSKSYRVYIPTLRRVVVHRDVQFEEVWALRRLGDEPENIGDQLSQEQV